MRFIYLSLLIILFYACEDENTSSEDCAAILEEFSLITNLTFFQ